MQRRTNITLCSLSFILAFFSLSMAQQQEESTGEGNFQPYGNVEMGDYEPWNEGPGGAIFLSGTTPGDQHPDVNLVGPNGFWERFEVDDDRGADRGAGELQPGVYSIASSDTNLQLVETKVEVREGQAVRVHLNLEPMPDAAFDAATYPAYPPRAYRYGPYAPYNNPQQGAFSVEAEDANTLFVVTGPNGYSRDFRGSFTADPLVPGVYSIAATGEGQSLSEGKVEVRAAQTVPVVVALASDTQTGTTTPGEQGQSQQGQATAQLQDTNGNAVGNATFTSTQDDAVQVQVELTGVEPGVYGIHIHETGQCSPNFDAAGGHFNPTNAGHGLLNPDGPHAGDLPNITVVEPNSAVTEDGTEAYVITTKLVTLGGGETSLFDDDGSALMVHAQADDYITDPLGDSGDRIACGVISRQGQ